MSRLANADDTPFAYETWSNRDGKIFEARVEQLLEGDIVVLQSKKGGTRYNVKRILLSEESNKKITSYIENTKKNLLESQRIEAADIYKAVALGLKKDAEVALIGKSISLNVSDIKIATDKLSATLQLESGLFARLQTTAKYEFYENKNTLYIRTKVKGDSFDSRFWWSRIERVGMTEDKIVAQKGLSWKFDFTEELKLTWERIGVTDGVVITN